ncbi:right-handed parallel beta-helix repeat-containing protein [Rhodopirellula halodulae]|uniref:right-handed parallel beta-helix repeat-containing protein n=1 Tax=Rhodopirellula halodulae TaxID=2894198 RepID=UPI001E4FA190|nr:right-handed parallel beta-helix repeat-containing protein [Rhodopirellula sp. JC737]MCC9656575.1 right-handed parallel beta-helix repeat-containing protein [Rhodopirellula sp. JC737]
MLRFSFACVLLISATPSLSALDVYVSATGDDSNKGSSASPVASLQRARQIVQPVAGKQPVTVHVGDGVYYLPDTLRLGPEDSGTQECPVVYQAQNRGKTVLSGGKKLELQWRPYRDGVFQTSTPVGLSIDQLFVDGQLQRMARYPNYDPQKKTQAYQGHAADAFSKSRAAGWKDPTGGFIHAMHRSRWGGYHYRITGKDSEGNVTYEGGWQNNRPSGMHADQRMVENIFEELDAPGEWYHNAKTNTLYFYPGPAVNLQTAKIEVVRLRHLIEFRGTESQPVRHITLKGFVFRHSARTFMETKEQMLRSDWTIYRGGAVFLKGTEDITITDSEMDQLGGNAVFVSDYNRRVKIQRCHIHDTGASGVCFVGNPNAVRDPLFRYGEKNDLNQVDRTPGPKNNQYPADCVVDDCLIHGIGRVERQPAGVQIEMASQVTVRDCSIYDCARAGINIGDGAWGGHLIERCDVFDTVQETHDHGSFNSWGRDRYWSSNRAESQAVIDDEPDFPFLDAYQTTVIRNSRWRCDHGWDIDLDDGSSNYDIYNNLMLSGGLKLREGFRRRAWNNITINNGLHPHVWYNDSGDEVFSNIFMAAPQGARMPTPTAKGKRIDENLYYAKTPGMKDRYADFGWDRNSIVADPLFVNPSQGDFRVKDGSPAFEIGFENFPMDQFGVKDKSLKAIAATPEIPELDVKSQMNRPRSDSGRITIPRRTFWMGVQASDLKGAEFSAFGVSADEGGIALSGFTPQSAAAKVGLKEGDLIQAVNGSKTKRVDDLLAETLKAGDQPLQVTLIRDQRAMQIEIRDVPFLTFRRQSTNEFSVDAGLKRTPKVLANQSVRDEPLSVLVDGRLDSNYGPVFGNGVTSGIYKLDLGQPQVIRSVAVWSHHLQQRRGPQRWTLYASASEKDPGWNVNDTKSFRPLTSVDTRRMNHDAFNEVVYSAERGADLGPVRWLVWQVSPVTSQSENTSFQEIRVR